MHKMHVQYNKRCATRQVQKHTQYNISFHLLSELERLDKCPVSIPSLLPQFPAPPRKT